jgi:hypothetical protein
MKHPNQSWIELLLLEAHARRVRAAAVFRRLGELRVGAEIEYQLRRLWRVTRKVGRRIFAIGRILVLELVEFVGQNPHLAAGTALGAALSVLIGQIPWIGPLLAPFALVLGVAVGAALGRGLDKGQLTMEPLSLAYNLYEAALRYFQLLIRLLKAGFQAATARDGQPALLPFPSAPAEKKFPPFQH